MTGSEKQLAKEEQTKVAPQGTPIKGGVRRRTTWGKMKKNGDCPPSKNYYKWGGGMTTEGSRLPGNVDVRKKGKTRRHAQKGGG